jgi:hypothetical protein
MDGFVLSLTKTTSLPEESRRVARHYPPLDR